MRLILLLIALTIALPVSLSQAGQLLHASSEPEAPETKAVKTSSLKAANALMRADADMWLSSRWNGRAVLAGGETIGTVASLLMSGSQATAIRIDTPSRGSLLLPYDLVTAQGGDLVLPMSAQTILAAGSLAPLEKVENRLPAPLHRG